MSMSLQISATGNTSSGWRLCTAWMTTSKPPSIIADPALVEQTHEALRASDDSAALLRHRSAVWGVTTVGRSSVTDSTQLLSITA